MKTAHRANMGASKRNPKVTYAKRRKVAPRARQAAKPRTTALVIAAPDRKPWLLSPEEVVILKNAVCKGATDDELKYCLAVARRYQLDPFKQQIWFVPHWDKQAETTDGEKGGKVYVPVVGIGGLLHIAARDHSDFGAYSEPEYGPIITVDYTSYGKPRKLQVPEWARIETWKKGAPMPTVAKVWWSEIYPDIDRTPLVRRMPRLMLAKCAKAQATRTAYPETGGLLIPEETHSREFTDITPGGRIMHKVNPPEFPTEEQIDAADAENPHLKAFEAREAAAKGDVPALFYTYHAESETYAIDGAESLKTANRDLLKPLWSPMAKMIVATAAQLGKLISQFEDRKVPFRELKPREPGE